MKLELKHFAAYLPFEVECVIIDGSVDNDRGVELLGVNKDYVILDAINKFDYNYDEVMLLLNPLTSDLSLHTSKIMTLHEEKHRTTPKMVIQHQLLSLVNTSLPIEYRISKTYKWIIDYLLENHFDIFGLIDAGLAIDITGKGSDIF